MNHATRTSTLTDSPLTPHCCAVAPSAVPGAAQSSTSPALATDTGPALCLPAAYLELGLRRRQIILEARRLRARRASWKDCEAILNVDHSTLFKWCARVAAIHDRDLTAAHCAPTPPPGRPRDTMPDSDVRTLRALTLQTNRNAAAGSAPEAVRHAAKTGLITPRTAQRLLDRETRGRPMLTQADRHLLRVPEAATRAFRNPRNAWLDYVSSPGSLQFTVDPVTGRERYYIPGEAWTMDDGTINLYCCVPHDLPGCKTSRFGVMLGRFQFLLIVDHRSYYIPGFNFTARPRSSYRAEDLVAALHPAFLTHGAPRWMILEKGISASNRLTETLHLLNIAILRANSPHQKVVEFVFNQLWTKLSLLPGQVGRSRGEEHAVQAVVESCRAGATDPRKHFPMLADVLAALRDAIASWNHHHVNDSRYGQWVPAEFWSAHAPEQLRPVPHGHAWLFAPHVTDPLLVRACTIATRVSLMPGFSQAYTFSAPWLAEYLRARVKLHFNPFAQSSAATATLADPFAGLPAGHVLGTLEMIDRQARHTRRLWCYSDETDIGLAATRANAQALRRISQAICPDGKPGVTHHEARDGHGASLSIEVERGGRAGAPLPADPTPVGRALRCAPPIEDTLDTPVGQGPSRAIQDTLDTPPEPHRFATAETI